MSNILWSAPKAARGIHRRADDGEFEPVQSDIPEHDLTVVQSDAEADRGFAARLAVAIQLVDRSDHGLCAAQRVASVLIAGEGCAERRHQSVAEIFVQRAGVAEDFSFHALVERSQRPDDLDRASAIGIGGKVDDIGEQHGDILGSNLLERFVVFGQLLDDVG